LKAELFGGGRVNIFERNAQPSALDTSCLPQSFIDFTSLVAGMAKLMP
jgi:hypothetical protein